jgi:hypothetical protein
VAYPRNKTAVFLFMHGAPGLRFEMVFRGVLGGVALVFCVTGITHPGAASRQPHDLDLLIGGPELWSRTVPKIGANLSR